jgi:putative ABC transport system substrate-binding protein
MRRRQHLVLLGVAALRPAAASAQRPGLPVIGYLGGESPLPSATRVRAFREGLAASGFVEDRNVAVDYRWAEGRYERLPALAAELAAARVAVIVAPGGAPVAVAAKAASATIPIVFEMGGDPVALGVVASLSRPEGNITGVSSLNVEVGPKRLEMLHDVLPDAVALGAVINPTSPTAPTQVRNLQAAAEARGVRLHLLEAATEDRFEAAFGAVPRLGAAGLVFTSDPYFAFRGPQIAQLAARHAMPAITQTRDFTHAGGLMSYGGNFMQSHRQAGVYAGRVLRGEQPADLPVQQITSLELLINLRTARGLGLGIPLPLLASADEAID